MFGGTSVRKRTVILSVLGLCGGLFALGVWAKSQTPAVFTLKNGGERPITALMLAQPSSEVWGQNRLLVSAIEPGEQVLITAEGGLATCVHDLRADFDDGDQALLFSVDLCRLDGEVLTLSN